MDTGAKSKPAHQVTVRQCSKAAVPDVVRLFELVWPDNLHGATTNWALGDEAPRPAPLVVAVDSRTKTLVGARGAISWPLRSAEGKRDLVYQFHGTAVHPDYRRLGLFSAMTKEFLTIVADDASLIFNVSVAESRAGYEKMGWSYLPGFRTYFWPTRPLRLLRNKRDLTSTPVDLQVGDPLPHFSDVTEALEVRSSRLAGKHHTEYDEDFFRWRFGKPEHRCVGSSNQGFCFYRLRRRGALTEALVGDLWPTGSNIRSLLGQLVRREHPDVVTFWLSDSHPLRPVLRRIGVLPDPRRHLHLGIRLLNTQDVRAHLDASKWGLMAADIDTF